MVEVLDASKSIKNKIILEHINFKIEKGRLYGLEGTNGSGKTMFLRLICGLIKPTGGKVIVAKNTSFGVIIENPGFLFGETAYTNLKFLASINKKIGAAEINNVLDKVGLSDNKHTKVKKFSLGMVQKLGIAQAIMEKPDILLLDEPFNALDEDSAINIKNILTAMRDSGTAIILVSHNLGFIKSDCDRVCRMSNGQLGIENE